MLPYAYALPNYVPVTVIKHTQTSKQDSSYSHQTDDLKHTTELY